MIQIDTNIVLSFLAFNK